MFNPANRTPVEAAPKRFGVPTLRESQVARPPLQCPRLGRCRAFTLAATSKNDALRTAHSTVKRTDGFTLAELLVSVGMLVMLVLLATQLLNSAATVTILGHKQMDADSQARQVLDRMAIDFAQMVKRSDVDYYVKSSAAAPLRNVLQPGNDQITFYSAVPGFYPSTYSNLPSSQSPVSLVAYRINGQNKLERMGKGLVWNAVSTTDTPVVFMPIPLASPLPTPELPDPAPVPLPTPAWPSTAVGATDWTDSEVIGTQVFRFEYYYLLKNGTFSDIPWNTAARNGVDGTQDVSAIVVDLAVIDAKSKVLLTDADIATFATPGAANFLANYAPGMVPGQLRAQWQSTLDGITTLPRPAISGIRLYERFFYLSPPTLLTP